MIRPHPGGKGGGRSVVTSIGPLRFGLGAVGRRRRLATSAGSETEPATTFGGPVRGVAEVLGHVRHGLGRASKLAATLLTAGLESRLAAV